jgi:3-hydroxybutyryl-CoA dehydrogenase
MGDKISSKISRIAVIGAGTMGHGIALVASRAGYSVLLCDISVRALNAARSKIAAFLSKSIEKGKITETDKKNILRRIKMTKHLDDAKDCDLVIEAVVEKLETKKKIFGKLDLFCPPKTIFTSNTSTIPISSIAAAVCPARQGRFAGMHFMNPAAVMELVEVVKSKKTLSSTLKTVSKVAAKMGKTAIIVNDSPGFVANRILLPMINEAVYCYQDGVAPIKAIDFIMKTGMRHPMGPLELADLIGIDVCVNILEELAKGFNDSGYAPCPLLKKMVKQGYLGRKTGKGFYEY